MTFQLARHGAGPVGGRGRGGLGSRTRGRVLKRQEIMRNLLRSRSCGEPPRASQAGGERASVRDVLRALTGAYRGKASRGSVVLRLEECYMTRVAMVKKPTGSG
jgi:hypothetical protein